MSKDPGGSVHVCRRLVPVTRAEDRSARRGDRLPNSGRSNSIVELRAPASRWSRQAIDDVERGADDFRLAAVERGGQAHRICRRSCNFSKGMPQVISKGIQQEGTSQPKCNPAQRRA